MQRYLRVTCTMPLSGSLSEVNASFKRPSVLEQMLTAQETSGKGPQSMCQAYTAARAAASPATLPHVAAVITTQFGAAKKECISVTSVLAGNYNLH